MIKTLAPFLDAAVLLQIRWNSGHRWIALEQQRSYRTRTYKCPQQRGSSKLPEEWKNTTDSKTWVHKSCSYLVFCTRLLKYRLEAAQDSGTVNLSRWNFNRTRTEIRVLQRVSKWVAVDFKLHMVAEASANPGEFSSVLPVSWDPIMFESATHLDIHCIQCHSRHAQVWSRRPLLDFLGHMENALPVIHCAGNSLQALFAQIALR